MRVVTTCPGRGDHLTEVTLYVIGGCCSHGVCGPLQEFIVQAQDGCHLIRRYRPLRNSAV